MKGIFICYRRDDSRDYASRLYERLATDFGRHRVFMDIDIRPGAKWVDVIDDSINTAGILLAIIGKHWATIADVHGNPRIKNSGDHVQIELATAFNKHIPILPIFFEFNEAISQDELPSDIMGLVHLNYVPASTHNFEDSYAKIMGEIRTQLGENFLKPISLPEAFSYLNQIRSSIENKPLSDKEVGDCLSSFDPNDRINAYIELQIRPEKRWLHHLLNCMNLERFLADKDKETRPMWLLLECLHMYAMNFEEHPMQELRCVKFFVQQLLDFLDYNHDIDPGGECKRSVMALIGKIYSELCRRQ